jgi:hypothetical protein
MNRPDLEPTLRPSVSPPAVTPVEPSWLIYWQLTRFLLPLVLTAMVQEVNAQFVNGGMARVPQATETLASYGLAWGLTLFLASILLQTKQLGLVLVDSRDALRQVRRFVLLASLLLAGLLGSLTFGPQSVWVIEQLHGIDAGLSRVVREALVWFVPIPVILGLTYFYSGLLIRIRRTDLVSLATLASVGANITAVVVLLPAGFIQAKPILLPILVTYAGVLTELGVNLWNHGRCFSPSLAERGRPLTAGYIVRFYWPLALIMAIQGVSRPVINLFISHGPDAAQALAVLTVVYSLGRLPYSWLNEIRNLAPAFQDRAGSLPHIRRFTVGCALVSLAIMVSLFWTPLRVYILQTLIGLDTDLARRAHVPLLIFTFFSLAVTFRAYGHSIGLLERRTQAMAPSAPARLIAIVIALIILPYLGVHGAARGVAALLCGFVFEALVVWLGVRRARA